MDSTVLFMPREFWRLSKPEQEKHRPDYLLHVCAAFRRNDPTLDKISTPCWLPWPHGFLRPLGEALLNNTVVFELELNMHERFFWPHDAGDMQESDIVAAAREAEPLLQYIRSSATLRNIRLYDQRCICFEKPVFHWLCRHILKAIAENPCIEVLDVKGPLPMQEFVDLLSSSLTVRLLDLDVESLNYFGDTDHSPTTKPLVIQALRANQSLETLRLSVWDELSSFWSNDVLSSLVSHPKLQCIELHGRIYSPSIQKTLTLVIQQSTTLEHVVLDHFTVGKKSWKKFVKALELNSNIRRLTLDDCSFPGKKAAEGFIRAFRAMRQSGDSDIAAAQEFVEVSLRCGHFNGKVMADVLAQIWKGPAAPRRTRQNGYFFMRLSSLCRYCAATGGRCDVNDVARQLPHATHLRALSTHERDLSTCSCNGDFNPDAFVQGVRCNGSLHTVDVKVVTWPSLGYRRVRSIEAYCERNRVAPQLLSKRFDNKDDSHGPEQQQAAALHVQIFPPVFATIMPAWKMAPTTLLIGLTAAAGPATIGR